MTLFSVLFILCFVLLLSACSKEQSLSELAAAEEAVAAAKAEDAPDFCPDEYNNAELKLKQAQLLFDDGDSEAGKEAALEAESYGKEALDCALLAKQPKEQEELTLPEELLSFSETIFFDFNMNAIKPGEAKKLSKAAMFINKFQNDYTFFVKIETQADVPGDSEENYRLTRRRAEVIRYYLKQHGVKPNIIVIKPLGDQKAVLAAKDNKNAKKMNQEFRRGDITIISELESGMMPQIGSFETQVEEE